MRPTHIEVYVFRRRLKRVEFLALRRSPQARYLPGVWQPVTGKPRVRERIVTAAAREVREETGLRPTRWWSLERTVVYFDAHADAISVLPLFAAEVDARASIELSTEHDRFRFVSKAEAARLFLWESQRVGLEWVRQQVLRGGVLAQALDVSHLIAARRIQRPLLSRKG